MTPLDVSMSPSSPRGLVLMAIRSLVIGASLAWPSTAQLVADFTATPTTGVAPLAVSFTNTSSTAFLIGATWEFGDGLTSNLWHTNHVFNEGSYDVTLTLVHLITGETATVTKPGFITASPSPDPYTIDFDLDVTSGTNPLQVMFTDTTSGAVNTSWLWEFGDGNESTVKNPTHVYSTPGVHTVSLTASWSGAGGSVSKPGAVTVLPTPLRSDFGWATLTAGDPPQVAFQDRSEGAPTAWSWDFGDGGGSTLQDPTHTYVWPGKYLVTLETSVGGQISRTTHTIAAQPGWTAEVAGVSPLDDHVVVAADMNGDGHDDLVIGDETGTIRWLENDDAPGWSPTEHLIASPPVSLFPRDLEVVDIDGDGDLDVVVNTPTAPSRILWYEHRPGTTDWPEQTIFQEPGFAFVESMGTGDVDGDGDADVLAMLEELPGDPSNDDALVWFENLDGKGAFGIARTITQEDTTYEAFTTGDVDGDGSLDVVLTDRPPGTFPKRIRWYPNAGDGTFPVEHLIDDGAYRVEFPSLGDLDGDGDLDLFAGSSQTSVWYPRDESLAGGFDRPIRLDVQQNLDTAILADIDADGDLDIVVQRAIIRWYENRDGAREFVEQPVASFLASNTQLDTADLDGDGDRDIIGASAAVGTPTPVAWSRSGIQWGHLGGGSPGAAGTPRLTAGGALAPGSPTLLQLDRAPSDAPFVLWLSFGSLPTPALGGTLFPHPVVTQKLFAADADGTWTLGFKWSAVGAGVRFWLQAVVLDGSVPAGLTLSNGLTAATH